MNRFHYFKKRLRTQPLHRILRRIHSITRNYGMGPQRFREVLFDFVGLVKAYNVTPTLPVTATVLNRQSTLFRDLEELGVELAVHGHRHVDYTQLHLAEVVQHLQDAMKVFRKHHIICSGHRFPYLRWNREGIGSVSKAGFQWDSSRVISWNSLDPDAFQKKGWESYQRILKTYQAKDAEVSFALPVIRNGLIEIPVSVPDDEILIERLGIRDNRMMSEIWERMLRRTRSRGELLVLQVHPERFREYRQALNRILRLATDENDVWAASLGEIARWWKERNDFHFRITEIAEYRYRITAECTDRATVLQQNGAVGDRSHSFNETAAIMEGRTWEMVSPVKPVIGVESDASPDALHFLKSEGFAYETRKPKENYSLVLDLKKELLEQEKHKLLERIQRASLPLLRFWRWPNAARFSLAVTGDIDAVDLKDFWGRLHG